MSPPLRAAVFASGGGTNLQSLLDHGAEAWRVALVVSDRPDAGALRRAGRADVPTVVVPHASGATEDPAGRMLTALAEHDIDFVLLAGYMKLVPAEVVERYTDRIVNVHPALLPSFGGKGMYGIHVHRAVLQAGVRLTGPTVHLVDEVYDRGRIIAQWPVPVKADDTPEDVAARVLRVEHSLYPRVVDHLAAAWRAGRTPGPLDESGAAFRLTDSPDV
ncbi:MAG: phosphoribosylglycinamide formyltransferase [Gemmatimonadota bacterium]|nr:phosphoribosylglycinamide formyltransferase [Gemmatimonadota bacterium]